MIAARVGDVAIGDVTVGAHDHDAAELPRIAGGAPLRMADPWAIQLSGGTRCVVTTGTTDLLRGVPMRYQCPTGTAGLLPQHGTALHAQFRATSGAVRDVPVVATWTA